jgi:hypothetical protein
VINNQNMPTRPEIERLLPCEQVDLARIFLEYEYYLRYSDPAKRDELLRISAAEINEALNINVEMLTSSQRVRAAARILEVAADEIKQFELNSAS